MMNQSMLTVEVREFSAQGSLISLYSMLLALICLIVAGETNSLCKGNSNEVVDIDPTDVEGPCQYSVSAPACMPQEDCSVKEISRLDRLFRFSNYEVRTVVLLCTDWKPVF